MYLSLSARRAWIEINRAEIAKTSNAVALRKESVDRNCHHSLNLPSSPMVALRKESVDRNRSSIKRAIGGIKVALRKESVDRNAKRLALSWAVSVALRKESVDRNLNAVQIVVVIMRRSPQGERG